MVSWLSSLRKQGPIATASVVVKGISHRHPTARPRRMGPCVRTIGCTHLENRLKYRSLDDPRFWECLHVGPSATVEKTHVFYTCRPPIKRCVHALVRSQGRLVATYAAKSATTASSTGNPAWV